MENNSEEEIVLKTQISALCLCCQLFFISRKKKELGEKSGYNS